MKLESWQATELKMSWKIVRTDTCEDVPGMIISADEDTGECKMFVVDPRCLPPERTVEYDFKPGGIRIVPAARR